MPGLKEEAKLLLRRLEASARKKLGQHFMVDENTLGFIAAALDLKPGETVVEIGPGLGFLTRLLLARGACVIAIEKDPAYAKFLTNFFADQPFQIEQADVLKTDLARLVSGEPVKVFGNIPYNITSPILEWLILQKNLISEAVLTVQREVAERLQAAPGTREWGALSVFLQYHAEVKILKKLSPAAFSPAPKVDSAVIHISLAKTPKYEVSDQTQFFRLIRRAFQKRRKTLLNALADETDESLSKKNLQALLNSVSIDPTRRPETLKLEEWVLLSKNLPFCRLSGILRRI